MAARAAKTVRPTPTKHVEKPKKLRSPSAIPEPSQQPSSDEIRLQAYLSWEAAGMPFGDGVNFWLEAEQALLRRE